MNLPVQYQRNWKPEKRKAKKALSGLFVFLSYSKNNHKILSEPFWERLLIIMLLNGKFG